MPRRRRDSGETLPLFPEHPEQPTRDYVSRNRERLLRWARHGIFFGTSSWKYPGWKGMVYSRPYPTRRSFEQDCLAEYATLFPTVCADFAFYDFPDPGTMRHIAAQTPEGFRLALKVTDRITVHRYPDIARYGALAGTDNPDFMNVDLFDEAFLAPLQSLGNKRGAIIFEFSTFFPSSGVDADSFTHLIDDFLGKLPPGFSYAVEVRNTEFLTADYLAMLRAHGVAHVLNSWTRMPPIIRQLEIGGVLTTNVAVIRALLKPGRSYGEAVGSFKPYDRIREENPELRQGVVETVRRCVAEGRTLYAYVNNRAEGNSPKTIEAILDTLDRYPEKKL